MDYPSVAEINKVMKEAEAYIEQNIKELCVELDCFYHTGVLGNGKVRSLASDLRLRNPFSTQTAVIGMIETAAIKHIASQP